MIPISHPSQYLPALTTGPTHCREARQSNPHGKEFLQGVGPPVRPGVHKDAGPVWTTLCREMLWCRVVLGGRFGWWWGSLLFSPSLLFDSLKTGQELNCNIISMEGKWPPFEGINESLGCLQTQSSPNQLISVWQMAHTAALAESRCFTRRSGESSVTVAGIRRMLRSCASSWAVGRCCQHWRRWTSAPDPCASGWTT